MKEFKNTEDIPWHAIEGFPEGFWQKILSADEDTGSHTRMVRFGAGAETEGTLEHDFWEEILILEGELIDIPNGEVFGKGYYTCRPPGVKHGPYKTTKGCLVFEVRNYAKGRKKMTF
jgi:hypothetical protein